MKSLSPFKRGDTFSLACKWKSAGVPTSINGLTIKAQVRNTFEMTLIDDLRVVVADQSVSPGVFTLVSSNPDTNNWPIGTLVCDLQILNGETIRSSDSFYIPVIEDITK